MNRMSIETMNQTPTSEFFFLGFASHPDLQSTFFTLFLFLYLMTLLGNSLIIAVIGADARLHTPMYFFLGNLAILDICCTSSTIPKMLENLRSETKSISYPGCITQLFLLSMVLGTEILLLTVMSFDRYMAICVPLRYASIMSLKLCVSLVAVSWCLGLANSLMHTCLITRLSYTGRIMLDHFFCEIPPVLKASSSDTHVNDIAILVSDIILGMFCFFLLVLSYTYILSTIAKMRASANKKKALSTCSSHLLVVTLFYGGIIYTYLRPYFNVAGDKDKVVSVLYAVGSPVLNPLIYSLRNEEVKGALLRILAKKLASFRMRRA